MENEAPDLSKLTFQFAKTMPETPHWYVKRTPENDAEYVKLFWTIAREGVVEKWGSRTYRYWYPGDGYKYWAMTPRISESRIINRAKVDPDGAELPRDDGA